jgi:branched-chain amino acid transport system permease protein
LEIRAVSDNGELSAIYGIDPDKAILRTYLFSSATGALAGILFSLATSLYPTMGFNLLLFGLTAMIIGGVGSYKGLVGGSLIVVAARQLAGYYIDAKWMDTAAYVTLLLFLIWKPYGLSGKRLRKVEI